MGASKIKWLNLTELEDDFNVPKTDYLEHSGDILGSSPA